MSRETECFSMNSDMSMRTMACSVEDEFGQGLGQFGFADPGGSHEDEGADGPVGVLKAGPRARRTALETALMAFPGR
jgi:hypothetical protein